MRIAHVAAWRRLARPIAVAGALLARSAVAQPLDATPTATATLNATATPPPTATAAPIGRAYSRFGLQLGAGVPDGAGLGLLYRPLSWVRLEGGLLYDYIGYGARAGVTIAPHYWVAPSLTLALGRQFQANAFDKLSKFATIDDQTRILAARVGYTFASAQLGLELGHPDAFVFFVHAGLTRMWLDVSGAAGASFTTGDTTVTARRDPAGRLGIPAASLGFMIFFF